jgi:hypothetical protein
MRIKKLIGSFLLAILFIVAGLAIMAGIAAGINYLDKKELLSPLAGVILGVAVFGSIWRSVYKVT